MPDLSEGTKTMPMQQRSGNGAESCLEEKATTVKAVEPLMPLASVAVMFVLPAVDGVANPEVSIDATAEFDDPHVSEAVKG